MSRRTANFMSCLVALACCWYLTPFASAQEQPPEKQTLGFNSAEFVGDYVTFADVGLKVRLPLGFVKEKSFAGFTSPADKASLMAMRLPVSLAETSEGFTKEITCLPHWEST